MEKSTLENGLSKKDIAILGANAVLGPVAAPFLAAYTIAEGGKSLRKSLKKDIKENIEQDVTEKTQKEITGLANTLHKQIGSDSKKKAIPDLQTQLDNISEKDRLKIGALLALWPHLVLMVGMDEAVRLAMEALKISQKQSEQEVANMTNSGLILGKTVNTPSSIPKNAIPENKSEQPMRQNPVGTQDAIPQKTKIIPKGMDYRLADPFELDEINNGSSNIEKIHLFEAKTPTAEYYVIEDKIRHIATVYKHGQSVLVVDTATGRKKGDALTVTTKDGKGNNNSTPAGMFRIGSTYIYKGGTSFQRSKIYEDYDIPSSVHIGNVPKDKNKCNISDGCTRIGRESADKLSKYVTRNSRWYILPEEEKTGKFKLTGSGISFKSNDEQKLHSEHARGTRNMTIHIPKELSRNRTLGAAVRSLEGSKGVMMDRIGISSDTYDKLALLTLGIMGRESTYGEPKLISRGGFGLLRDDIFGGVLGENVSAGPFQLKATSVPKDLAEKLQGNKKIDYISLVNPSTSAQYALLLLYQIYKKNAPKFRKKYPNLSLEEITLAYYANPAGVKNPEKHQMRIPYAKEVLENASKFKLNYQLPTK